MQVFSLVQYPNNREGSEVINIIVEGLTPEQMVEKLPYSDFGEETLPALKGHILAVFSTPIPSKTDAFLNVDWVYFMDVSEGEWRYFPTINHVGFEEAATLNKLEDGEAPPAFHKALGWPEVNPATLQAVSFLEQQHHG